MHKLPQLELTSNDKHNVFADLENFMTRLGLGITNRDLGRPWGGFLVIDEAQTKLFGSIFFPDVSISDLYLSNKLSPKILVVQPGKRLSWQYHFRRAELWRVVYGTVAVMTSDTDQEGATRELGAGDSIALHQGERHRLIGRTGWGVVAEIWQHTDDKKPSDEADIVRLQDDFGR